MNSVESDPTPRHTPPRSRLARGGWQVLGWICVVLAVLGVILPLMPATVFVILAAAAFGRGSPRVRRWIIEHPRLGPSVLAWEEEGSIPRRGKIMAYVALSASLAVTIVAGAPLLALAVQGLCLGGVAWFIATRPDGR